LRAFSAVVSRLLGAKTKPIKSAPALSAVCAASIEVIQQIFTFIVTSPCCEVADFARHALFLLRKKSALTFLQLKCLLHRKRLIVPHLTHDGSRFPRLESSGGL